MYPIPPFIPKRKTISFDGKTVCSISKMKNYDKPLHIVSAQIGELGVTIWYNNS
jgi:hypothetical protein